MAKAKSKPKTTNAKTLKSANASAKWRLTEDEVDAIESGIKALEQKAQGMATMGPFGTKGPFMYCQYAIRDLRGLLKRLK